MATTGIIDGTIIGLYKNVSGTLTKIAALTSNDFDLNIDTLETPQNLPATQKRSTTTLANPAQWLIDYLTGGATSSGVAVNANTAIQNSSVHGCVLAISRGVANMPLKKITGGQSVYEQLLNEPNPYQNGYDYRAMCVANMAYKGNSYSLIERDKFYNVKALHPIPVESVKAVIKEGQLYYAIKHNNINDTFHSRDVLHFKGLSISDPLRGENPIQLHADEIGVAIGATQQQGKSQKNGVLKFLVKSEKTIPETAATSIKKDLTEIIDEDQNIAVLPNGAQVERLQLTPPDRKKIPPCAYRRQMGDYEYK